MGKYIIIILIVLGIIMAILEKVADIGRGISYRISEHKREIGVAIIVLIVCIVYYGMNCPLSLLLLMGAALIFSLIYYSISLNNRSLIYEKYLLRFRLYQLNYSRTLRKLVSN